MKRAKEEKVRAKLLNITKRHEYQWGGRVSERALLSVGWLVG